MSLQELWNMSNLFAMKQAIATGKPVKMPPEKNGVVVIIWPDRPNNNAKNDEAANKMLEGHEFIIWGIS